MANIVFAKVERRNPEYVGTLELCLGDPALACAAATINGRASESRNAEARVIGRERSLCSSGACFRLISVFSAAWGFLCLQARQWAW